MKNEILKILHQLIELLNLIDARLDNIETEIRILEGVVNENKKENENS